MTNNIEQKKDLRDELNEAIYTVITTQYKKDAKEAHEIVSAFGYSISKYDWRYRVISKETGKAVYVCYQSYSCRRFSLGNKTADQTKDMRDRNSITYNPCRVDFVGFLNKPFNKTWYNMTGWYPRHSRAVSKFRDLEDAKWDIKYHGDKIEQIKAEISRLEDELISYARRQKDDEERLRRLRREYHLA